MGIMSCGQAICFMSSENHGADARRLGLVDRVLEIRYGTHVHLENPEIDCHNGVVALHVHGADDS